MVSVELAAGTWTAPRRGAPGASAGERKPGQLGRGLGATAQRGQTRAGSLEHKSDVHGDSLAGAEEA